MTSSNLYPSLIRCSYAIESSIICRSVSDSLIASNNMSWTFEVSTVLIWYFCLTLSLAWLKILISCKIKLTDSASARIYTLIKFMDWLLNERSKYCLKRVCPWFCKSESLTLIFSSSTMKVEDSLFLSRSSLSLFRAFWDKSMFSTRFYKRINCYVVFFSS